MLIVLDIAVIKRASEVAGKIGDPKSLSDAGAEKPQKNGGPTAQQNEGGGLSYFGLHQFPEPPDIYHVQGKQILTLGSQTTLDTRKLLLLEII